MSHKPRISRQELFALLECYEKITSELGDALAELAAEWRADQGLTDCSQNTTSPSRLATTDTPPS
jgi:hypothetical protein